MGWARATCALLQPQHIPMSPRAQTLGQAQAGWGGDGGPALAGDVHAIYQKDTGVREEFHVDGARR